MKAHHAQIVKRNISVKMENIVSGNVKHCVGQQ